MNLLFISVIWWNAVATVSSVQVPRHQLKTASFALMKSQETAQRSIPKYHVRQHEHLELGWALECHSDKDHIALLQLCTGDHELQVSDDDTASAVMHALSIMKQACHLALNTTEYHHHNISQVQHQQLEGGLYGNTYCINEQCLQHDDHTGGGSRNMPMLRAEHNSTQLEPGSHSALEYLRSVLSALTFQGRSLLQDVIVPGNPLDRTFAGYASDFDLLALLTVALNFQEEPAIAGRTNSANSARVQTFKGGRFPFGINFAVTNTFGAKTKGVMDLTSESNRVAAVADGATDVRAIAFPVVGDVQAVQGLLSSAISQTRIQQKPPAPPPPPSRPDSVPRIPLDPKFIPKYVVQLQNITNCRFTTGDGIVVNAPCPPAPPAIITNMGQSIDKFGKPNRNKGKGNFPGRDGGYEYPIGDPQGSGNVRPGIRAAWIRSEMLLAPPAPEATMGGLSDYIPDSILTENHIGDGMVHDGGSVKDIQLPRGFGNASVAGDRSQYRMYEAPDRIRNRLQQLEYEYYNGAYNDETFEAMDPALGHEEWHYEWVDPYFYVEYDDPTGGNTTVNGTAVQYRSGVDGSQGGKFQGGGEYTLRPPVVSLGTPFKIFLASSLDYGRAGQYAYFYTNYFRFLYTYYFGPQVVPATSLTRSRSTSYVKRNERASTAGAVQSEGTGQDVAAVVNSVSAATGNSITQAINVQDLFGNSTFIGPPNLLTRYAGAQASAVAFGRSYYYTQNAAAVASASSQANVNDGYVAGAGGGFTAYSSGSQFSGTRGQALAGTGEVWLDWDAGGPAAHSRRVKATRL